MCRSHVMSDHIPAPSSLTLVRFFHPYTLPVIPGVPSLSGLEIDWCVCPANEPEHLQGALVYRFAKPVRLQFETKRLLRQDCSTCCLGVTPRERFSFRPLAVKNQTLACDAKPLGRLLLRQDAGNSRPALFRHPSKHPQFRECTRMHL